MSAPKTDRPAELLPAAEESVIGSMLIDSACVGDVLLHIRSEDFSAPRLRALFIAARDLFAENQPVDVVTVSARAGGGDMLDLAMRCMDLTPTAASVLHYCDIVREQTALNRLHRIADELAQARDIQTARDLLARASAQASDKPGVRIYSIQEIFAELLRDLEKPSPEYIHWGLNFLDSCLRVDAGNYVIIGARPSTGKTALALQLAQTIACSKRVGIFSLEGDKNRTKRRLGASTLSLTLPQLYNLPVDDATIRVATTEAANLPFLRGTCDIIPLSTATVSEIRSIALAQRYDVIIIDYLQLLRPEVRGERKEVVQSVSMDLRAMAQLTGITIIALAQLRRPDTQKGVKAPTMDDLKESGQLEQDADVVLLMYHVDPQNVMSDRIIKIAKNKEGHPGLYARFAFDGEHQRFTYVDKDGNAPKKAKFEELPEDDQYELPFE